MFESVMQTFLSLLDNVSANPGCEYFFLIFDSRFNSNIIISEVTDIELSIFDLMLVVLNTEFDDEM